MPRQPERNAAVAAALYAEARSQDAVPRLAAEAHEAESTVYDWTSNRSTAGLWLLSAIERAWGIGALQRIVRAVAPRLHVSLVGHEVTSRSLESDALQLGAEVGDLERAVTEGGADGHFDELELKRCERECDDVERRLNEVRAKVRAMRAVGARR